MRYTKSQLEELLWRQLQHIEEQNEVIALLREQSLLLKMETEKLRIGLGLVEPAPIPYRKQRNKQHVLPDELKNFTSNANEEH